MPNDVFTLKLLTEEIRPIIIGCKINKIFQITNDSVGLSLYKTQTKTSIILNYNKSEPSLFISNTIKPLDHNAVSHILTAFKKHLLQARLKDLQIINNDRILKLIFENHSELFDSQIFNLYFELMNGQPLLCLCNNEGKVLYTNQQIFNSNRTITITSQYSPPIKNPSQGIMSTLGNESRKEFLHLVSTKNENYALQKFSINKDMMKPCITVIKNINKINYYPFPYESVLLNNKNILTKTYYRLNDCLEYIFNCSTQKCAFSSDLSKIHIKLQETLKKLKERLQIFINNLELTDYISELEYKAEVFKNNYTKVKYGMKQIVITHYDGNNVLIELKPNLSVKSNLENYYKRIKKLKRTVKHAKENIPAIKEEISYIESMIASLKTHQSKDTIDEIRWEFNNYFGLTKNQPNKKTKQPKPKTITSFKLENGTLYIGKNHVQNDYITFSIAKASDYWLHVKDYHGSHGILSPSKDISPSLLNALLVQACEHVAFYSEAKFSSKVEIIYTLKKNVKKTNKLGMVNYTNYKSIVVTPKPLKDLKD